MALNAKPSNSVRKGESPIHRPIVFLEEDPHIDSPNAQRLMDWKPRRRTVGSEETNDSIRTPQTRVLEDVQNFDDSNNFPNLNLGDPVNIATPRAFQTPSSRNQRSLEETLTPSRFRFNSPTILTNPQDESFAIIERLNRDSLEMRAQVNEMRNQKIPSILDFDNLEKFESSFKSIQEHKSIDREVKAVQTSSRQETSRNPRPSTSSPQKQTSKTTDLSFHSSFHAIYSVKQTTGNVDRSSVETALRKCIDLLNVVYKMKICLVDIQEKHNHKCNPSIYDRNAENKEKESLVEEFLEQKRLMKQRIRKSAISEKLINELKAKQNAFKHEADRLLVECKNAEKMLSQLPNQKTTDQAIQTTGRLRSIPEILSSSFNASTSINQHTSFSNQASIRTNQPSSSNEKSQSTSISINDVQSYLPAEKSTTNKVDVEASVDSSDTIKRSQEPQSSKIESVKDEVFLLIEKNDLKSKDVVPPLDFSSFNEDSPLKPIDKLDSESAKMKSMHLSSRKRKAADSIDRLVELKSGRSSNRDTENDVTSISTDTEVKSEIREKTPKLSAKIEKQEEKTEADEASYKSSKDTGSEFSTLRSDGFIASELQELPNSINEKIVETFALLDQKAKSLNSLLSKTSTSSRPVNGGDAPEKSTSRSQSTLKSNLRSEQQTEDIAESVFSNVPTSKSTTTKASISETSKSTSPKKRSSRLPLRIVRTPDGSAQSTARSRATTSISELLESAKDSSQPSISINELSNVSVASDRSGRRSPADRFRANFPLTYDELNARESLPHSSDEIKRHASSPVPVEANRLPEDLNRLSIETNKSEQTTESSIKTTNQTLFDVTHVDYLELVESRHRLQHKADRLMRNTMRHIVKYYWHKNLKSLIGKRDLSSKTLQIETLRKISQLKFQYENERLRLVDEEMRILITRLHNFVLDRIQFIIHSALIQFTRDLSAVEFRKEANCSKLEELIDTEIGLYSSFYCMTKTVPMAHQTNRFERRTNAVDLSRRRGTDHVIFVQSISNALKQK